MILREAEPVHRSGARKNPSVTASMLLRVPRAGTFVVEPQWAGILNRRFSDDYVIEFTIPQAEHINYDAGRFAGEDAPSPPLWTVQPNPNGERLF